MPALDIVAVGETDTRGTYVFDVHHFKKGALHNAVVFSRQQLIGEITKKGYNILLVERYIFCHYVLHLSLILISPSWQVTVLRRAKHYRVEVQYGGRRMSSHLSWSNVLTKTDSGPC